MPDPFEVHGRSDWERRQRGSANAGAISDQLADPAPAKAPPARKNLWDHCKQAPGKMHHPVIVHSHHGSQLYECKWGFAWVRSGNPLRWRCNHTEECEFCGKRFRWSIPVDECPDYPGCEEQKAAARAEFEKRQEEILARNDPWSEQIRARKLAKSQRTSYRRPKAGKK
jgi:hypothetical protein